eukprot:670900_1
MAKKLKFIILLYCNLIHFTLSQLNIKFVPKTNIGGIEVAITMYQAAGTVEVEMYGPIGGWFGVLFGGTHNDGDSFIYTTGWGGSDVAGEKPDYFISGKRDNDCTRDSIQNWDVTEISQVSGKQKIVGSRPFNTGDSNNDYTFQYGTSQLTVWTACGSSLEFDFHGKCESKSSVRFQSGTITTTKSPTTSTTKNPTTSTTKSPTTSTTLSPVPTPQPVLPTPYPTTPTASAGDTVCLWGMYNDANFNTHLNGLFVYNGLVSQKSSYKKSKAPNCGTDLYIYTIWNQWVIGESPGVNSWYASCSQASLTACVANTWTVLITQSTSELDPNLRVISGACPYWNCGRITTNSANGNCDEFGTNIGVNAWKSATGFIWHFNPVYWSWFCLNANQDYLCTTSSQFITNKLWLDASLGGSTSLTTGTTSLTVQCLPTTSPTTPKPTPRPVASPVVTPQPTVPTQPTPHPVATIPTASTGDTLCIWDRYNDNNYNTMLNGLFAFDGISNGQPAYVKTKAANCGTTLYIYHFYGLWVIGTTKGAAGGWYATCSQTDVTACIGGTWSVVLTGATSEIDSNMRVISGSCPYWNCGRITTNSGNGNCNAFNTNIGVNTWVSTSGYIWYFNPTYWNWFCMKSSDDHLCSSTHQLATLGWVDIPTPGTTKSLTTSTGSTLIVSCLPTTNPTTPQPTPKPTARPADIPTPYPTVPSTPVTSPTMPVTAPVQTPQPTMPTTKNPTQPGAAPTPHPVATIPTVSSGDTVCIWDRYNTNHLHTKLNGLYTYDGLLNGRKSYKKGKPNNCGINYWIWYYYGRWIIGTIKGHSSGWFAMCAQSDLHACVAGQWDVRLDLVFEIDTSMRIINGACPYWNCGRITTTSSDTNCQSFNTNLGVNTWLSSSGYVWYFNPEYWSWRCINSANDHLCSTETAFSLASQWVYVSLGSSRTMSTSTGSAVTVSCLPTSNPTTPQPTPKPTERPTPRPTPKPVVNPVPTPRPVYTRPPTPSAANPANMPVTAPVVSPVNPANNPAYIPITPVVNPAYSPVYNPVDNPAHSSPVTNPANSPVTNPAYAPAANPASNPAVNPAANPASNPATRPDGDDDDDDDDNGNSGNGNGNSGRASSSGGGGEMGNWWIYVIIGVAVCCCCIILVLVLIKAKRNKDYKKASGDPYADTVQMNPNKSDPYAGAW